MSLDLAALLRNLPARLRLLLTPDDIRPLKGRIATEPVARQMMAVIATQAEEFLDQPMPVRVLEGRRLLHVSRAVLSQVMTLGLTALLNGDERYARSAIDRALAAAAFVDWNPGHFLDVGEMTAAIAICHDWLRDHLTESERDALETAIIEKGLLPSLTANHWAARTNNWNPVCHGGLTLGALCVAQRDPELAHFIISRAITNVPVIAAAYTPDGAYDEGPMYWTYGTTYLAILIAALQTALGKTFDLDKLPGLASSADYMMHVTGPGGQVFNYSDSRLERPQMPVLFWFASHFAKPSLAAAELATMDDVLSGTTIDGKKIESDRFLPLALIWYRPMDARQTEPPARPLVWFGGGLMPVALMRSAWNDPTATYLAIKGGSPGVNHAHMDVGSFVMEADGVRWAIDLSMQDYHSLESAGVNMWNAAQGGDRWTVFRLGPGAHNILQFDGAEQNVGATATVQQIEDENIVGGALVELTSVYAASVKELNRKAVLRNDRSVLIEDQWRLDRPCQSVVWQMLTDASIEIGPNRIGLSKAGKRLAIIFATSDKQPRIEIDDVSVGVRPTDAANPGVSRIRVIVEATQSADGFVHAHFVPGGIG